MRSEKEIEKKIKKLEEELETIKCGKVWKCRFCKKGSTLSSLTVYKAMYWNDDPYALGCYTSRYGDYYIPCLKCKKVNRIMCDTKYNYSNPKEPIINKENSKDWLLIHDNINYIKKYIAEEHDKLMKTLKIYK